MIVFENVLTDECIALTNSVKKAFPNSNHYICSWPNSLNIKRNLGRHGFFGTLKSKFEKFIFLIIIIEIKDETEKASYIQLLTDLQSLPFCLSKNFVERILNEAVNNKYLKDFDYLQTLLKRKKNVLQPIARIVLFFGQEQPKELKEPIDSLSLVFPQGQR